jgi:hypothetical protein
MKQSNPSVSIFSSCNFLHENLELFLTCYMISHFKKDIENPKALNNRRRRAYSTGVGGELVTCEAKSFINVN